VLTTSAENFISKLLTYRRTSPTWFKETFHKIKPPSNIEGGCKVGTETARAALKQETP
jgi:hypothetical protein